MGNGTEPAGVTSNGVFSGDNPLKHSLLLLIVQLVVILCFTRLVSLVLRPLRQPRVVAEIIGGVLLGPTAFGRIPGFSNAIFPPSSLNVLQTVANFGLVFFLFLVGLELDWVVLKKAGSRAVSVAAAGIVVPFALSIPVSLQIFEMMGMKHSGKHFGLSFILFMGISLSITAFPILARLLTERKIINTEVGKLAISAAALNDVVAWVLIALAVAVTNSGSSPLVILWIFIAGILYLGVMFVIVRPFMHALAKLYPPPEVAIAITFLLVLISSFITDAIGINVIFGGFILGLITPDDQPVSELLKAKTKDFVLILLLPLYFTSSGLNVELDSISNGQAVAGFLLVTATAFLGKVVSTVAVAKSFGMGLRTSVGLGFLMSCKGLVELVVLNIAFSKGVINKEIYAIMVLMALVTTTAATPMIMWLYKPARRVPSYERRRLEGKKPTSDHKLRMLVCLYGIRNLPSMMNVIEMSKGRRSKLLQVSSLHLLELSESFETFNMTKVLKAASEPSSNEDTDPQDDAQATNDAVATSLRTFGQVNKLQIRVTSSTSRVSSMHEDICSVAVESRANIIILPHHKYSRSDGFLQSAATAFPHINRCVLKESPCSVAILVDQGLGAPTASLPVQQQQEQQEQQEQQVPLRHLLVLFFGGPDDREALFLAKRMVEHDSVKLTIVQCLFKAGQEQAALDNLSSAPKGMGPKALFLQSKDWLMTFGRSLRWFRHHNGHEQKGDTFEKFATSHNLNVKDSTDVSKNQSTSTPIDGKTKATNYHRHVKQSDHTQVAVSELEQENEKKQDAKLLGHFLAAATHFASRITVKALQMDAIEELLRTGLHSLVIVGLHSSRVDGLPCSITDHGLGSLGNWLVSMELLSTKSSLLVVWQHGHSCIESVGAEESNVDLLNDVQEKRSVVDVQEASTRPVVPKSTSEA